MECNVDQRFSSVEGTRDQPMPGSFPACPTLQRKALGTRLPIFSRSHPGQSFSVSLCGLIAISRANAHMVHMGYKTSTSHDTLIS